MQNHVYPWLTKNTVYGRLKGIQASKKKRHLHVKVTIQYIVLLVHMSVLKAAVQKEALLQVEYIVTKS